MSFSATAVRAGRAFVELYADTKKLDKGLRRAQAKLRAMGRSVNRVGTQMLTAGATIAAPLAIATKVFAGFDDQMRTVQAVLGATGKDFDRLTEKAKLLGRTTSYTAAQVAGAMVELARAGFDAGEIDAAIGSMLALARATGTELAEATGIAGNTLRAFGLQADQSTRVADVLTATANNSAQTLTELGESMKYAAPVAAEYGMTLEETAKSLGTLANFGIKGSMAGTSLRTAMLRLADPAIRTRIEELGVAVIDTQGNMRGFSRIMQELGSATAEMPGAERLALFNDIFGRRAITGGIKLTAEGFDKLNRAIAGAAGTAKRAAADMDSGIGGTLRRLWSAIEGTAIAVGDALAPALEKAGEKLTEIVGGLTRWIARNRDLIVLAAKVAGGLLAVGIALKGVAAVLGIAAAAVGAFSTALNFVMLHPVIAGVGLLAAVLGVMAYRAGEAGSELSRQLDQARELRREGDKQRAADLAKLDRLKKLSEKERLNNTEKAEAKKLAAELEKTYGDLGIRIDEVTGKIGGMSGALETANKKMQRQTRSQLEHEIRDMRARRNYLLENNPGNTFGGGLRSLMTGDDWVYDRGEEAVQLLRKIKQTEARLKELDTRQGLTGGLATEPTAPAGPAIDLSQKGDRLIGDRRKLYHEVLQLQIARIKDEQTREIASLDLRYMERIRLARKAGQETRLIEKARQLEIDAIHRKHAERRAEQERRIAEGNRDLRWQIAGLEVDAGSYGADQKDALRLQLEYAKALERAKTEGLDTALVDKVFELRRSLLDQDLAGRITTQARGSFGVGAFADALSSGSATDRIAKASEQTAKNTKTLITEVKRKAGLQP